LKLENEKIKMAIANVLKRLDIAYVDDTTYKRLVNIGLQYAYIESELLEQLIEAELIILLGQTLFESS
jgi:hypothetical protein